MCPSASAYMRFMYGMSSRETAFLNSASERARIMASSWSSQPPSRSFASRAASGLPAESSPTTGPWCVFQKRRVRSATAPSLPFTFTVSVQVVACRCPSP